MNKTEILTRLADAKVAHKEWLRKAELLVDGYDIKIDAIPVSETECDFGVLFYHDCKEMKHCVLIPSETIAALESIHTKLHDTYAKIYQIFFASYEISLLTKLFGKQKNLDPQKEEQAQTHLNELEKLSEDLLDELTKIEIKLKSLSNEELERIALS